MIKSKLCVKHCYWQGEDEAMHPDEQQGCPREQLIPEVTLFMIWRRGMERWVVVKGGAEWPRGT